MSTVRIGQTWSVLLSARWGVTRANVLVTCIRDGVAHGFIASFSGKPAQVPLSALESGARGSFLVSDEYSRPVEREKKKHRVTQKMRDAAKLAKGGASKRALSEKFGVHMQTIGNWIRMVSKESST